ncbi:MAG: hypothetical protein HY321_05015 [Armatimonadetes bacterium]|nr:hypothetical protein [Armatimonadota bacterium]
MPDLSLTPEYATWRSARLQLPQAPVPEEGAPRLSACYRKEFTLPAAPRQAALTLYIHGSRAYWFAVNGRPLLEPREDALQLGGLTNLDVTEALRAGKNVLTFRAECQGASQGSVTIEGIVFCEDGTTYRILSDGWQGGWNAPKGWDGPDAAPQSLAPLPAGEPLRGTPDSVFPRPYYGPIQVTPVCPAGKAMSQPVFDEEAAILLKVTLPNQQASARAPVLTAEVVNEFIGEDLGTRTVPLAPEGKLDLAGTLDLGRYARGAYRLRFRLADGDEEVDRRDYEVAVVGEIPQRLVEGTDYEDGLDLREVYSIDCTAPTSPETFVASHTQWGAKSNEWKEVETRVVTGPAGRYRVLAETTSMLYFAYKYKVKKLYVPHLAVVEWPDDARRNFIVHVAERASGYPESDPDPVTRLKDFHMPGGVELLGTTDYGSFRSVGFQRSEAGLVAQHDQHPVRSNKLQKLHLLFWPNSEEGSVHVCNVDGGDEPAAAARVTIYEITNDLPALRIADAGDRLIGPHTERGPATMSSTYYSGPLGSYFTSHLGARDHPEFYRDWYTTTENWIKRARFSGQNFYLMGHFMYQGTLYPSRLSRYGFNQNKYGGGDVIRDYAGLILRMFERNGMAMVSGIEFFSVPALVETQPTPEEIRAGEASPLFMVSRRGTLFPLHAVIRADGSWWGSGRPGLDGRVHWPAMNFMHPGMQERLLAMVGELADLYGEYPAWKGVALVLSRCFGPMEPALLRSVDLLEAGYEDYTIDLFEKETGTLVPVDAKDPERFEKRYQWIMGNVREGWIDWRTRKYTELYRRLGERVAQARPDVKLHLIVGEPMLWRGSQEILDGRFDDLPYAVDVLRQFGFDLDSLRKEPGIVLTQSFPSPGSGDARMTDGHDGWREFTQNQAWQSLFANDNRGGAYVKSGLQHWGNYTFPEGKWLFRNVQTRQGWFWSTYAIETFVNTMVRSNPTWIPHTWTDISDSMGRIQEQRLFARAYRSLPNGRYERLTGNGLDRNLWVSRTQAKGATYAYAANLHWWAPEVTLRFSEGARVHDLIKDQPVALQAGAWAFRLEPYQIQSFRVSGGTILSAETRIPAADREYLEGEVRCTLGEARDVAAAARARERELAGKAGWEALRELEGRIARAQARLDQGDLAGAYTLISGALPVARDRIAGLLKP